MIKESFQRGPVYGFTNENLTSYNEIYNFDNAEVLTILGSGDQYFTCLLNGAKNVDVYDINRCTWFHFVLKFMAIKVLSYHEFYDFFINKKMDNMETYRKISRYLPIDVLTFFYELIKKNRKLSSLRINSFIGNDVRNYQNGRIIPYFDEVNYYKLQEILNNIKLPNMFFYNVKDLPFVLNKKYDIMLLSNIYQYLRFNENEYRKFLEKFPVAEFQALYTWVLSDEDKIKFLESGFTINLVDSIMIEKESKKDFVLSLIK